MNKPSTTKKSATSCPSTYKTFSIALQALVFLNKQSNRCSSSDIASFLHSEATVLRRIFAALSREQIIQSREGRDGGYRLGRNAESISLADVYSALQIHDAISDSMLDAVSVHCYGHQINDAFSDVLADIEESTLCVLKSRTIADISGKTI
ncbi:Rrf2 family protein [Paenibacillus sp. DS2015]|uniref:RrF2 family transcriptional regulator n=1 Tax=Paenibacillus sp. DS2015 TaxID=3373917 RepID=UPI003D22D6F1